MVLFFFLTMTIKPKFSFLSLHFKSQFCKNLHSPHIFFLGNTFLGLFKYQCTLKEDGLEFMDKMEENWHIHDILPSHVKAQNISYFIQIIYYVPYQSFKIFPIGFHFQNCLSQIWFQFYLLSFYSSLFRVRENTELNFCVL